MAYLDEYFAAAIPDDSLFHLRRLVIRFLFFIFEAFYDACQVL